MFEYLLGIMFWLVIGLIAFGPVLFVLYFLCVGAWEFFDVIVLETIRTRRDRISARIKRKPLTSEQKRRGVEIITSQFNEQGDGDFCTESDTTFETELKNAQASAKAVVVYDTCFLMLDKIPLSLGHTLSIFPSLKLELVVPTDVEKEIKKHMDGSDESKNQKARVARKRLAELIEMGANIPSLPELQDYNSPTSIGADSATDKRLIAYAEKRAKADDGTFVLVATDDGGIMLDISHMRKSTKNIIAISKEMDVSFLFEVLLNHIVSHAKDEKEVASLFEASNITYQELG